MQKNKNMAENSEIKYDKLKESYVWTDYEAELMLKVSLKYRMFC